MHRSNRRFVLAFLAVVALLVLANSGSAGQESRHVVLLGASPWDADAGVFKPSGADFLLEHMTPGSCILRTLKSAASFIADNVSYDRLDHAFVQKNRSRLLQRDYPSGPQKDMLGPGTLIVFQTGEGRMGKMEIKGFRSSHDFSFDEAAKISEKLRDFLLKKPENEKHHLEIVWAWLD